MPADAPASHPLADLYVARALDPVIDLTRAVAADFVRRPQLHTRASAEDVTLLANFRLLTGKHPEWPNAAQRSFASAKLMARMAQPFAAIRLAAIQYVRAGSDSGAAVARRVFTESAGQLRATAQPLDGAALSAVTATSLTMVKRAVSAVSSAPVAAAYGMTDWRAEEWPESAFSPRFGYLCESISQSLALSPPLLQPELSAHQRAARHGGATIAAVCGATSDDDDDFAAAVHSAVEWAGALSDILARLDVPRAWQDPAYRSRLHPLQRDMMPPHPSGEVDLEGTVRTAAARFSPIGPILPGGGGFAFSTETLAGEVCCSTGDLVCDPVTDELACPSTGEGCTNGSCHLSDDCPTLTEMLIA